MEAAARHTYLAVMGTRFFEWLGRVVMLSLAGMITLSIIGAIAAIPSGSIGGRPVVPQPEPERIEASEERQPAEPSATEPAAGSRRQERVPAAASAPPAEPEKWEPWLEAITYALLALAGIAALATAILWRSLHQARRIADALEALAQR